MRVPLLFCCGLVLLTIWADASPVRCEPDTAIAGTPGTWTLTYTVGARGIAEGGALRVNFPDEWHSGPRNSATPLQHVHPADPNYVSAATSRANVSIAAEVEAYRDDLLVKHAKPSLDGRSERYVQVVRVRVVQGNLVEGDTLSVIYGDTSGGSSGFVAGDVVLDQAPILVGVDTAGDGNFVGINHDATITLLPGPPAELQLHGPSEGAVGKPISMLVALLDEHYNPTTTPATIALRVLSGSAEFPESVSIPAGASHVYFNAVPTASGVIRMEAHMAERALSAWSNPTLASEEAVQRRLYWGDLHSHSHYSWDGVGRKPFDYARNTAGLDFYALTDHAIAPPAEGPRGLNRANWPAYNAETEAHYEANRFVTLHAYECSFGRPYGHHNVYFRGAPGAFHYGNESTLPALWADLIAGDALTIPHHTGKFPTGIQWAPQDDALRRNFEIYSGHGLSEAYAPSHPLAFEQSQFTSDAKSLKEPTFAVDAWQHGLRLSTIAASDDHRAKPGQPHFGLTAVRADALTRDGIFQALHDRHTYGTSGAKIILDLRLGDTPMGQIAGEVAAPVIRFTAHGTDKIAEVEVLRWQPGEQEFTVIQHWSPDTLDFEGAFTDTGVQAGAIYYGRLRQENTIRGRAVVAWTSPIWTE